MKKTACIVPFLLLMISLQAQKMYDIPCEEGNIHFEMYGSGNDTILVINGGPGMHSEGFRTIAKLLGEERVAVIYDQRGTGKSTLSEVNEETITLDNMVKDIETIREYLHLKEWGVLGHSFGGMMASYYTTLHPQRVCGLVLSSSGGVDLDLFDNFNPQSKLTQTQRDSLNYWSSKMAAGDTTYYTRYQRGKHLAPAYLYDQSFVPMVADRMTQGNWDVNGLVFQDMRGMKFDCKSDLKQYPFPVLIIQGEEDIVPKSIAEKGHQTFPNSKLVFLERCGHYGWLERKEAYLKNINEFLDGCRCS